MKPAHWSKVTKTIAGKFGISWGEAKATYKSLKSQTARTPSLRMVSALPATLPNALKGVTSKTGKTSAKSETVADVLPSFVKLAPKAEKPFPAPVRANQGARNKFEKALKEQGLPVAAIARNDTGKVIAAQWKNFEGREKLTKLLKQGYGQIARNGAMGKKTVDRIADLLEKQFGVLKQNPMWNNILRQLYGNSKGKK